MQKRLILIIILSNSLMLNPGALRTLAFKKMLYENSFKMGKEGFISPEIFIYFSINSDSNLTQTQMLTLKLSPNRTLTQTLILTLKKQIKKARMNISHFCFILFNLKIFGEIVTTNGQSYFSCPRPLHHGKKAPQRVVFLVR